MFKLSLCDAMNFGVMHINNRQLYKVARHLYRARTVYIYIYLFTARRPKGFTKVFLLLIL